ncbi:pseudoazurin [Tistlia consotensis]|uniref:Pseudoazurin n=1 Tax=Tistlia consotensis USBA 355 TaxID=560819 RepID=A0A1Y6CCU4_9PROT|nr:pseudoazurin [Tistlia consotensis]SMF56489.1 pseudoazurin [Tistlia consotensis USBA 355]SNR44652.1 pseudoazurin [Tistlia consotensis]
MFPKFTLSAAALLIGLMAGLGAASAADHEVKMLNRGSAGMFVFEPSYLEIAPGDSVTFVPVDKGHNAETLPGIAPDGTEPFKGKFGKEVTVTFEQPGVYGYKCAPHYALGMVGLVVVGDPSANLAAAEQAKVAGKAKAVMAGLLARAEKKVAAAR